MNTHACRIGTLLDARRSPPFRIRIFIPEASGGARRAPTAAAGQAAGTAQDTSPPFGIFFALAPDEYLLAGSGLSIKFIPEKPGPSIVGLGTVQEGTFVDGRWVVSRQLGGDDTGQGTSLSLRGSGRGPGIMRVKLYRYQ